MKEQEEKNMSNKIVFVVPVPRKKKENKEKAGVVRLTPHAYGVLNEICAKTGATLMSVASKLIEFGYENSEVRFATEEENEEFIENMRVLKE